MVIENIPPHTSLMSPSPTNPMVCLSPSELPLLTAGAPDLCRALQGCLWPGALSPDICTATPSCTPRLCSRITLRQPLTFKTLYPLVLISSFFLALNSQSMLSLTFIFLSLHYSVNSMRAKMFGILITAFPGCFSPISELSNPYVSVGMFM